MIKNKKTNIFLFALPSIIVIVILIIMLTRSDIKAFIETAKDSFEREDTSAIIDILSNDFYQNHNITEENVRSYLDRFFSDHDFPEVYIRYVKTEKLAEDKYIVDLLVRVLAVPKRGLFAGAYGDRRVPVFGSPIRGRGVRIRLTRTIDGFMVDSFETGASLEEEMN